MSTDWFRFPYASGDGMLELVCRLDAPRTTPDCLSELTPCAHGAYVWFSTRAVWSLADWWGLSGKITGPANQREAADHQRLQRLQTRTLNSQDVFRANREILDTLYIRINWEVRHASLRVAM